MAAAPAPRRGPRPPRPDRRPEILDAAAALATEEGMGAVSVRAVAERAGIGASTLRYWYPSQDELVAALARRLVDPQLGDRRLHDTSVPPADRLVECLEQFLPAPEAGVEPLEQWVVLVGATFGPHATPLGRALYAGGQQSATERVRAWVAALVAEGAMPAERADVAVPALLSRVDGLCLGLLPPATVPDLATAHAVLRADVEALLRPPDA